MKSPNGNIDDTLYKKLTLSVKEVSSIQPVGRLTKTLLTTAFVRSWMPTVKNVKNLTMTAFQTTL